NNDPLIVFFLLLAIYYQSAKLDPWRAGLAFGMSCNIKVFPLMLLAVFLFNWKDAGSRMRFFCSALAIGVVASVPYVFIDPVVIVKNVLGYGGAPGVWGITRLLTFSPHWVLWNMSYIENGKYLVLIIIAVLAYVMNHLEPRATLYEQCGLAT